MNAALGYALVMITSIAVLTADGLLKVSADRGTPGWILPSFWLATALYAFCAWPILHSLKTVSLGQMGVAFSVFSLLGTCAMGIVFFDEPLGMREVAGITLAVAALVLMARIH